jgi:hypothetical protein
LLFYFCDGAAVAPVPSQRSGRKARQTGDNTMQRFFRLSTAIAGLWAVALLAAATPASAGDYCRQDAISGMRACGYASIEQCQAMSSGIGGTCYRDPFLPAAGASSAYAYAPLHGGKRATKPGVRHDKLH